MCTKLLEIADPPVLNAVAAYALVHIVFTLLLSRAAEVSRCCICERGPIGGDGLPTAGPDDGWSACQRG